MIQTGLYQIVALPDVDETALAGRLAELGDGTGVVGLTRVTSGFAARVLRRRGTVPFYVWELTVRLMTAVDYAFDENIGRLNEALKGLGVVADLDVYTETSSGNEGQP